MNARTVATLLLSLALCAAAHASHADPRWYVCGALPQTVAMYPVTRARAAAGAALSARDKAAIRQEIRAHGWPSTLVLGRARIDHLVRTVARQTGDAGFDEDLTNAMWTCAGVELDRTVLADLNDRLEIALGHPQQFGTQYRVHDGHAQLREPLDEHSMLLRGMYALEPLAEQTARIEAALAKGATLIQARALPHRATLPPLTDRALRKQLLALKQTDQANEQQYLQSPTRAHFTELAWRQHRQTQTVKQVLGQRPLPDARAVGIDGVEAAFLLVQHADDQPWFVHQSDRLQHLMREGSLRRDLYALYADRLAVREGKPQLYGSQFLPGKDPQSQQPYPITDPDHLDARRASMNLGPYAAYRESMQTSTSPTALSAGQGAIVLSSKRPSPE